jgi:saccharopine dehydrogenase-like NADP-dependent oxidoreductase
VAGAGAVGARAARQLLSSLPVSSVSIFDPDPIQRDAVITALGVAVAVDGDDQQAPVVLLAGPRGTHLDTARAAVLRGASVVSASDDSGDVRSLLALDDLARDHGVSVVVGAGFAPGLACLLAQHGAAAFDEVDEIHVAKVGTGGPACAAQHHHALVGRAFDWRDGTWVQTRAGSGRELAWFPDPIGAHDCYRAALPDTMLLVRAFPGIARVTARMAANRRDRVTAHLPMLRRPHPEGGVGALRVELRGRRGEGRAVQVLGAIDRPALAAGVVAALCCVAAATGSLRRTGAGGVAEMTDALPMMTELAERGVKAATFEGAAV